LVAADETIVIHHNEDEVLFQSAYIKEAISPNDVEML